jgi:hypothetical protein
MENDRFGVKELSDMDLIQLYNSTTTELNEDMDLLDDPTISSELESELRNDDIPYAREKLTAIANEIDKRGISLQEVGEQSQGIGGR